MQATSLSPCWSVLDFWKINFEKSSLTNWSFSPKKSISEFIFAGYTGSKNSIWNRLKIQFIELDFSKLIFQKSSTDQQGGRLSRFYITWFIDLCTYCLKGWKMNCLELTSYVLPPVHFGHVFLAPTCACCQHRFAWCCWFCQKLPSNDDNNWASIVNQQDGKLVNLTLMQCESPLRFQSLTQVFCSACHSSSLDTGCVLFFVAYFDFFYVLKDEGNVHICYIFGLSLKYVFLSLCISPILKLKRKSAKKDKTLSNNFVMLKS